MSDHDLYTIGGDDVIRQLADNGWEATPEEVKTLAQEVRRLRATLEDIDTIQGRTVMRFEIDLNEYIAALGEGRRAHYIVVTAPRRLEDDPHRPPRGLALDPRQDLGSALPPNGPLAPHGA